MMLGTAFNKYFVKPIIIALLSCLYLLISSAAASTNLDNQPAPQKEYVGPVACKPCHQEEYLRFAKYAKKNHSFKSILRLKKGLTDEEISKCYSCHTTGYGRPGGFISSEKTPHLKNAGCEVCHGPGGRHVVTTRPEDIKGDLSASDCEECHTSERVKAFRFKPLLHGGAH